MSKKTVLYILSFCWGTFPLKAQSEWHVRHSGTSEDIVSVAYGQGVFLATDGRPLLSRDGIQWSRPEWPGAEYINFVTWMGDKFLGFGYNRVTARGAMFISSDGQSATRVDMPNWTSAAGDASCLFAVKTGEDILVSCMVNLSTPPYSRGLMRLTRDLKPEPVTSVPADERELIWIHKFKEEILACYGTTVFASSDGIGWSLRARREKPDLGPPVNLGNRLLSSGMYSEDAGATWEKFPDPWPVQNSIVFGNGSLVGVGGELAEVSSDGKMWMQRETGSGTNLTAITYGTDTFVAVGESGQVVTSHTDSAILPLLPPEIEIVASVTLKWKSNQGVYYQPEASTDLKTWVPAGPDIPGTGTYMTKSFEVTNSSHYFRISAR